MFGTYVLDYRCNETSRGRLQRFGAAPRVPPGRRSAFSPAIDLWRPAPAQALPARLPGAPDRHAPGDRNLFGKANICSVRTAAKAATGRACIVTRPCACSCLFVRCRTSRRSRKSPVRHCAEPRESLRSCWPGCATDCGTAAHGCRGFGTACRATWLATQPPPFPQTAMLGETASMTSRCSASQARGREFSWCPRSNWNG